MESIHLELPKILRHPLNNYTQIQYYFYLFFWHLFLYIQHRAPPSVYQYWLLCLSEHKSWVRVKDWVLQL